MQDLPGHAVTTCKSSTRGEGVRGSEHMKAWFISIPDVSFGSRNAMVVTVLSSPKKI